MAVDQTQFPISRIFTITLVLVSRLSLGSSQCSKQEYQQCVYLADPLLKDPHLIYPDNPTDVDKVCSTYSRTWTQFVDCVKRYTDRCFSDIKKQEFNKAVESPIDSVHQLCTDSKYQKEYLKHAACMKSTLTEDSHCGRHYRYLVSRVAGETNRNSICCAHYRFRECVLDQTQNSCSTDARPFSQQILDKSLSFLRDQCSNYSPTKEECPGTEFYDATGRTDSGQPDFSTYQTRQPSTAGTTPGSPWSSQQPTDERFPGGTTRSDWTTSWVPGQGRTTDSPPPETSPDGSTRSSFGRGMTWGQPPSTTPTWRVTQAPWFPTRPQQPPANEQNMMNENTIDEPNQQGLEGNSSATAVSPMLAVVSTLCSLAVITIYVT
ncbi:uncharacterized protein LOC111053452 isoform X1 [Nilaparvata lugens]|uniref:uncharacterized protein LOC111053452 isoform X1 n=1 Tax=Nilaparvata lugens TaxID=108931 RepID=UPI00193DBF74|nr:uncharacterized protein LOC111053452 isoform X1 [Nilaparvata lugens]XP_039287128.1 uncharacterized protein LOC111053452 isoform X1 [Nilaparvata lugens]XP_039287129.1 uncharacterized protein LOC111053452 isoform X1 [Nilaparvata lugens]